MIEWALILMPLLVLPIVILFRFVGCAQEPTPEEVVVEQLPPDEPPSHPPPSPPVDTKPPNYQKYILGEPNNPGQVKNNQVQPNGSDVIAYWRLVDASTTNVAEDLKKFQNGVYMQGHVLPAIDPTPTAGGSEKRDPAHFIPGEKSLIDSDPKTTLCRGFEGGYVFVEYEPGLYTEEFTIEAWIKADALAQNFEHTLFDAVGFYGSPAGTPAVNRCFRIFANRDKSCRCAWVRAPLTCSRTRRWSRSVRARISPLRWRIRCRAAARRKLSRFMWMAKLSFP